MVIYKHKDINALLEFVDKLRVTHDIYFPVKIKIIQEIQE